MTATINKQPFEQTITPADTGGSAVEFAKGLSGTETQALSRLVGAEQAQAKPLEIFEDLESKAGLPQLRKTSETLSGEISSLEDALKGIRGNVQDTSRQSLLTQGQAERLVESRSQPLREQLATTATAAGRVQSSIDRASQGINTKVGLALQGQEKELEPFRQALELQVSQNARMLTGFTADKQQNLTVLLDKLQAGRQLSIAEFNAANQLASEEKEYEFQKDQLAEQELLRTDIVDVGGRRQLINTQTGEVIQDLGSAKAPGQGSLNIAEILNLARSLGGGQDQFEILSTNRPDLQSRAR